MDEHRDYYRRRADELADARMRTIERKVDELDGKVDTLIVRIGIVGAVGSVVILIANIVGPVIASQIIGGST